MNLTPEIVEICGIHAGDGYLRKRGNKTELEIGGSIEEEGYYNNHVVPLFKKAFQVDAKPRPYSKGTCGLIIMNRNVANVLNSLGFPYGKKSKVVTVPINILNSENKIFFSRFLRGLFDTDGHLGFRKFYGKGYSEFKRNFHSYPTIRLTTVFEGLANNIIAMLNFLEIRNFLYSYKPKNPRDNHVYCVVVNGVAELEKWMRIIGTKNPVKLSRYLVWRKFGFCPTRITLNQREDLLNEKLHINDIL
jgi:hypothetical protein